VSGLEGCRHPRAAGDLGLDHAPFRIEAYRRQYFRRETVGSLVVFERGRPLKRDTAFKIKATEGPNDYASLQEKYSGVLLRHVRSKTSWIVMKRAVKWSILRISS